MVARGLSGRLWPLLFAIFSMSLLSGNVNAEQLKVAVAANFKPLLSQLKSDFERRRKVEVLLSSASTGVLYAQIRHGAPFDVFLAADEKRPLLLEQQKRIVPDSRKTYAVGKLVLWHAQQTPNNQLLQGWQGKIAMANPKTAPYGQAAKSVLQQLSLWRALRPQLVTGANIAQTQQFVQSGNVELGFIALSQALVLGNAEQYWLLPQSWYAPLRQQAVILQSAESKISARDFLNWLLSSPVQQQIINAGYDSDVES